MSQAVTGTVPGGEFNLISKLTEGGRDMRGIGTGMVCALVVAVSGQDAPTPPQSVRAGVYTKEQATRGQKLYAQTCTACHGDDLADGGHDFVHPGCQRPQGGYNSTQRRSNRVDQDHV